MKLLHITEAVVCGPHSLSLSFDDGAHGIADMSELLAGPVFAPLRDPSYFALVELDRRCGTVVWPNGSDIAPEALRALIVEDADRAA